MILILALTVILFLLALITRRRFGVLGLALCAGALLAGAQTSTLSDFFTNSSFAFNPLSNDSLSSALLILLPSFLLLFGGPRYGSKKGAIIGSIGYSVLASILLIGPLSGSITFDTASREALVYVARYESVVIAVAVTLSVIDMLFVHMPKLHKDKKAH